MKIFNCSIGGSLVLFALLAPIAVAQGVKPPVLTLQPTVFGAVGNNSTDDTKALQNAIYALPPGGSLDFGDSSKSYLITRSLTLKGNANYTGHATIRMSPQAPFGSQVALLIAGQSDNVTINGLTFDSSNIGGGLAVSVNGGGSLPAHNVSLLNMTFRNTLTAARGAYDGAVYNPVGWIGGTIANNLINNCGSGISISNAQNLIISDNSFNSIVSADAIFLVFNPAPFASGTGIQILRNRGQDLGRIAIELWSPLAGSTLDGPIIANNAFTNWRTTAAGTFGISVMTGVRAQITNNSMIGGVANLGYGIELGAPNSTVQSNTIRDFAIGIALQDSQHSTISNNLLLNQEQTGIEISNSAGSKNTLTIANNNIWNPKYVGIMINTSDWGTSTISGNNIMRSGGQYVNDNTTQFTGIGTSPPNAPVTLQSNSILQVGSNPPGGFGFIGIRLNGPNPGSTYDSNSVISNLLLPNSAGIYVGSPGALDGAHLTNNTFQLLANATAGGNSGNVSSSNNRVVNCPVTGPINLSH